MVEDDYKVIQEFLQGHGCTPIRILNIKDVTIVKIPQLEYVNNMTKKHSDLQVQKWKTSFQEEDQI